MIRKSLTKKLIIVFSAILVMVVVLNVVINGLLLPRVHRERKLNSMESLYESLANACHSMDKTVEIVEYSLTNDNVRVFIWDKDDKLLVDSLPLSRKNEKSETNPHDNRNEDNPWIKNANPDRRYKLGRTEVFLFYMEIPEENVIKSLNNYSMFSFESFDNPEEENLHLRGYLPNGNKLLLQMPVASITEAIYTSNILLLLVGVVMLVAGIIIVALTSRHIAKPVKELSSIAKSMEELDFSKKYHSNRTDEIGSLGKSINSLSEKLENTINELYDKNKTLEKDIELKSKIDTMRKEFIANASHELKTPVALIQGYAEGLRDNVASDEESRRIYTDVIIEESERMDHIIHQMLDLMEIDGTDSILDGRVFSLSELVENVISEFDVVFKNKEIKLFYNSDKDCDVWGDYWKIHQAITNYVSNAINHATNEKEIRINLKNTGDKVELLVYNSGIHINEEELSNIWERFYKLDKAHTRAYGGTGLGLSIVKSVIDLHGGECGARNLSDGVEFYFILKRR